MIWNLSGQNKDFGGTKQGFWGDQKSVLKLKSLPNFHFLLNLGLQKYDITPLAPLLKIQLHPLVPPNSFGPPTMVAVVADFKDRAQTSSSVNLCSVSWGLGGGGLHRGLGGRRWAKMRDKITTATPTPTQLFHPLVWVSVGQAVGAGQA